MVDKLNPAQAANLYQNTSKIVEGPGVEASSKPSFGDFLKQSTVNSIDTMKAGEKAAADAITGDASLPDVVQAITAAEVTLQTVVTIRDRLVSAYQEIMRMPI